LTILNREPQWTERELKVRIRAELPAEALARHPARILLGIPLLFLISIGTAAVILLDLPWYAALTIAVTVGALYASFFFFGHEVAHGAIVRSRPLQDSILYLTCLIYCMSPHLFRVWHIRAHHGHTNRPGYDPDTFGTLERFRKDRLSQVLARLVPGSGHVLSALYLVTFFTLHSQGVLWRLSHNPAFRCLRRRRACLDTAAMAAFWITLSVCAGPRGTLWGIIIPMLTVNFVMMSYIVTNHMLRPITEHSGQLETTMSVTTFKALDLLFFHFSHHIEHHLFPSMSTRYYPLVRRGLLRYAADQYLAPPHWKALVTLFRTPRLYFDSHTLIDPAGSRRVPLAFVESALRGEMPLNGINHRDENAKSGSADHQSIESASQNRWTRPK
jgi:fatty acid desaturase